MVVEDDPNIARLVDMYLRPDSYRVSNAADGATGPRISGTDRPHVFERLYVARHAPRIEGSGSGLVLTIVAELTEVMGATASVTARPPAGTGFNGQFLATEQ